MDDLDLRILPLPLCFCVFKYGDGPRLDEKEDDFLPLVLLVALLYVLELYQFSDGNLP